MKAKFQYFIFLLALLGCVYHTTAQGTTAFTYQGQLHDSGTNANGTYSMTFKLYDSVSGGTQIGSTLSINPTLANGLFTVNLDFGNAFNGSARWLDITVQSGSDSETLSPRVQVLPAPYAQFAAVAATVTNGAIMSAQLATNSVATTNIQNNAVTATQLANGAVTNRNLTANAVNATNIASGQVVKNLNGLSDLVTLAAGTNITLSTNGQILTVASASGGPGNTNYIPNVIYFFTNGTVTVPPGVTKILVEMWAGGGGGGNGSSNNCGTLTGGGGGGGSYAKGIFNVSPGANYIVTVGAGGAGSTGANGSGSGGGISSLGNLIVATGGGNGGGDAPSPCSGFCGGDSGSSGNGHNNATFYTINGGNGMSGCSDAGGGNGGGGGGPGGQGHGGSNGSQPGGGGGGADPNNTSHGGGNGANGLVIIYY